MSAPTRVTTYRRHATGQAFVQIRGEYQYLGKHGTPESQEAYRKAIAEYLVTQQAPCRCKPTSELTVGEWMLAYVKHVEACYVKEGRATDEQQCIRLGHDAVHVLETSVRRMAGAGGAAACASADPDVPQSRAGIGSSRTGRGSGHEQRQLSVATGPAAEI